MIKDSKALLAGLCLCGIIAVVLVARLLTDQGNRRVRTDAIAHSDDSMGQTHNRLRSNGSGDAHHSNATEPPRQSAVPSGIASAGRAWMDTTASVSRNADPYVDESLVGLEPGFDPTESFEDAAREFGVPAALLKAIAYVQSRIQHNDGLANPDGRRGLMGLTDSPERPMLKQSAQMLGEDATMIVRDPVQNIRAAAALLKSYRNTAGAGDTGGWRLAVERFSARPPAEARQFADEIVTLLQEGLVHDTAHGRLVIEGNQQSIMGAP